MSSQESLNNKAKEMIQAMRSLGIAGKTEGKWRTGPRAEPTEMDFEDIGHVNDFTGIFFVHIENDKDVYYFNPPDELGLEHDDSYGKDQGYWRKFVPKEIRAVRTLVETGISAPKSSSELRSWDSRKISKYLLGEAENYEALYACIIAQLENVGTSEARVAIDQLTELMETKTEPVQKTRTKILTMDDEEELSRGMESMSVKKKSPPKPKAASPPKPRAASPKKPKAPSPKGAEKMDKLIAKYKQRVADKGDTGTIADAIKRLAKELDLDSDHMEETYDFYGFGRSRLQPNRRKSRRRSNKKLKISMMMKMRRTSGVKRKIRRTSGKSLKKNKRRTSKRKTSKKIKKSFGSSIYSSIYGLQGGMQTGPIYQGVYPMTLKVNETLPNLNNVKRSYTLNEFGTRKERGSKDKLIKKQSKKLEKPEKKGPDRRGRRGSRMATVVDSESSDSSGDGSSFGCGLYGCGGCGRSFGCSCDEKE